MSNVATRMDEQGNRIIVIKEDNILKLYIALKSENRRRSVGFINTNTKVLHITRCRPRHLFRKLNAYGFSYQIIKDAKKFNKIRLKDEKAEWLIPTSFILDKNNSDFLHFKGNGGFELQVFLPLDKIEQFKRPERF